MAEDDMPHGTPMTAEGDSGGDGGGESSQGTDEEEQGGGNDPGKPDDGLEADGKDGATPAIIHEPRKGYIGKRG